MLDGLKLSEKLEIARQWFARSSAGEFAFTDRHRDKFAELLESCRDDALKIEPSPPAGEIDALAADTIEGVPALQVYVPDEFRVHGFLEDMAAPTGNVVALVPRTSRRLGGAS